MAQIEIRGRRYSADPQRVRFSEMELISAETGLNLTEFNERVSAQDVRAMRVFFWVLMRRDNPDLRFEDTEDLEAGEVTWIVDATDKAPNPGDGGRAVDPTEGGSRKKSGRSTSGK